MSRFKTAPVAYNDSDWQIARRKGNRVRYQNKVTAEWDRWTVAPDDSYIITERDPNVTMVEAKRVLIKRVAEKNRARSIQNTAEALSTTTVATLRDMAKARGIKVPSKARKADIIIALTESR